MLEQLWGLLAKPAPQSERSLEYDLKNTDASSNLGPDARTSPADARTSPKGLRRSASFPSGAGVRNRQSTALDAENLPAAGHASPDDNAKASSSSAAPFAVKNHDTPSLIAKVLRALATKRIDTSWEKLCEEFEVQKLIWQSVRQVKGNVMGKKPQPGLQQRLETVETGIDDILNGRAADPKGVLQKLKQVYKEDREVLSNSMRDAIQNVISQECAYATRMRLADNLEAPSKSSSDHATIEELEQMIISSQFDDTKFELRIRRTLGIPYRVKLGAPVGCESTRSANAVLEEARVTHGLQPPLGELRPQKPYVPASKPTFFRPGLRSQMSSVSTSSSVSSAAESTIAPLREVGGVLSLPLNTSELEKGGKEKAIANPIVFKRSATTGSLGISKSMSAPQAKKPPVRAKPRRWIVR